MYNICVHTTNGAGARGTLLGIEVAEAVEAVREVIPRGGALARQLLFAASAQEAVLMPRLLTVGHTSSSNWLREAEEEES